MTVQTFILLTVIVILAVVCLCQFVIIRRQKKEIRQYKIEQYVSFSHH